MMYLNKMKVTSICRGLAALIAALAIAGCGGGDGGGGGDCTLTISANTSNMTTPGTPIDGPCSVSLDCGGGGAPCQLSYTDGDMAGAIRRIFAVDQFEEGAAPGSTWDVAAGFTPDPGSGVHASYTELNGLDINGWTAVSGTIKLVSISGRTYKLELTNVHLTPTPDPFGMNRATGEFTVKGMITATVP